LQCHYRTFLEPHQITWHIGAIVRDFFDYKRECGVRYQQRGAELVFSDFSERGNYKKNVS
jgi:hypothetical protein